MAPLVHNIIVYVFKIYSRVNNVFNINYCVGEREREKREEGREGERARVGGREGAVERKDGRRQVGRGEGASER